MKYPVVLAILILVVAAPHAGRAANSASAPKRDPASEVRDSERAFAKTMADRDHAGFASFIAEDAAFRSSKGPIIGKAAIVADWKRFYEGPAAPFAWEPDLVTVQADGVQALSTGPVRDSQGKVDFRFMSVWRKQADGRWLIVLDHGVPYTPPAR